MVSILVKLIVIMMVVYFLVLIKDIWSNKEIMKQEKGSYGFYSIVSAVTMFLGTFGVSDTALSMFAFNKKKCIDDKLLPGTIIAGGILSTGTMAIAFLSSVRVDFITLITCMAAQTLGTVISVKIIIKMNGHIIRKVMGAALVGAAILIVFKLFFFGLKGGSQIGLTSWKLLIAMCAFFIFGGLNMIGMGATVPNMAVLLLLGMDSKAVFPVVMTANFISCCFGGFKFVSEGQYTRKAAAASVFGVVGVLIAVHYVKNMNVQSLQVIMIGLLLYCAFSMIYPEFKTDKQQVS